jgi:hypothetical protein
MLCDIHCPRNQDLDNNPPAPEGGSAQLLLHSNLYMIGDKYDVTGLKELAREKFRRACKSFWNENDFVIAAEHAYTTTMDDDEGLRDCVKDTLIANKSILARPDVKAFLEMRPQLMYQILIEIAK